MVAFNADLDDEIHVATIDHPIGEQETLAEWQRTALVKNGSVYFAAEVWFDSAVYAIAFSIHCKCGMIMFENHPYIDVKCLMRAYPAHKEHLQSLADKVLRAVALAKEES